MATSRAPSPRPRIASSRALPAAQGRRPFDRNARHRGAASIRSTSTLTDLRQHADAASRQADPGCGARHRRKQHPRGRARLPAAASDPRRRSIPRSWRCRRRALLLGRPLKWIEDRAREFRRDRAASATRTGTWRRRSTPTAACSALRGRHAATTTARARPTAWRSPTTPATNVVGPYVLPAYRLDINWCLTNFVPCAPTRGAGRPQGMYVMERLLDAIARSSRSPRDEIRRRNMIQPSQMPYPHADQAARRLDHDLRQRRLSGEPAPRARSLPAGRIFRRGRPRRAARGPLSSASASPTTSKAPGAGRSRARAFASAPPARSSSRPARARKARASRRCWRSLPPTCWTCRPTDIDRDRRRHRGHRRSGFGAFASRQAVTAGNAVHLAAIEVREKAIEGGGRDAGGIGRTTSS